eukprot:scaffold1.g5300.t1
MQELREARQLGADQQKVLESVKRYYGEVIKKTTDLKAATCLTGQAPHPLVRQALVKVPEEIKDTYYGQACCEALERTSALAGKGNMGQMEGGAAQSERRAQLYLLHAKSYPQLKLTRSMWVLDLGSGSGRDAYVCAALVGEGGSVTGVDMTAAQLEIARRHADAYCREALGYKQARAWNGMEEHALCTGRGGRRGGRGPAAVNAARARTPRPNLRFVEGEIENLKRAGLGDESFDLVISNCVVNLSPDKAAVLREAHRVLAPGGEMHFSDIYVAEQIQDKAAVAALAAALGGAAFYSITYRLFKLPAALEAGGGEDYGQAARYKGTIPGSPVAYALDARHAFPAGKWTLVSGNTAAMLGESWLAPHFEVLGDRSRHYGAFAGDAAPGAAPAPPTAGEASLALCAAAAAPACCDAAPAAAPATSPAATKPAKAGGWCAFAPAAPAEA